MNSLHGLAPKAKARRFRALLPIIEAKIQAGVCHADIMRALKEQGLALLENTYFTYLRRYRGKQSIAERRGAQAAAVCLPGLWHRPCDHLAATSSSLGPPPDPRFATKPHP